MNPHHSSLSISAVVRNSQLLQKQRKAPTRHSSNNSMINSMIYSQDMTSGINKMLQIARKNVNKSHCKYEDLTSLKELAN